MRAWGGVTVKVYIGVRVRVAVPTAVIAVVRIVVRDPLAVVFAVDDLLLFPVVVDFLVTTISPGDPVRSGEVREEPTSL